MDLIDLNDAGDDVILLCNEYCVEKKLSEMMKVMMKAMEGRKLKRGRIRQNDWFRGK